MSLTSFFTSIEEKVVSALGAIGQFLAVLFKEGVRDELTALAPIALQAVSDVAADPSIMTDDAKRAAAVAKVAAAAEAASIKVGVSLVNTAVEVAVQNVKAAAAPQAAAAALAAAGN